MKQKFTNSKMNLLMVNSIKFFRTLPLVLVLLTISISDVKAQDPVVIQDWDNLEEADFYFDVYYRIVKCNSDSDAEIQLIAFNEGGVVTNVGFELQLKDANGNEATQTIENFDIEFGATFQANCENDDYSFLKFKVPDGMDASSISIDITYNKG